MRRPSPIAPSPEGAREAAREAPDHLVVRVGPERFALPLAAVDEAIDAPTVLTVPGLGDGCLGVIAWRGRRVPLLRPERATGVRLERPVASGAAAALVLAGAGRAYALAVDEVHDAVYLADDDVRPLPGLADPHGVLRGVARDASGLIAVLLPAALTALLAPEDGVAREAGATSAASAASAPGEAAA